MTSANPTVANRMLTYLYLSNFKSKLKEFVYSLFKIVTYNNVALVYYVATVKSNKHANTNYLRQFLDVFQTISGTSTYPTPA